MLRRLAVLLALATAFTLSLVTLAPAQAVEQAPGRYIVVLRDTGADPGAVAREHVRTYGASVGWVYRYALKGYSATIPADRLGQVRSDPRVAFVSPDRPVQAFGKPVAPVARTTPTGVDRIDADRSSRFGSAAGAPAVAVIDTGSGPHADLNVVDGTNCSSGNSYNDGNGHGTHVAGTIGAKNDAYGVVGVAPGVPIYSVRVLNNAGSGSWSSVICGIDWVTANAVKVASMSLGGPGSDSPSAADCSNAAGDALHTAICNSVTGGTTYVVAAGNDAKDFAGFVPAAYDEVLTVTAMSDSDGKPGALGGSPACRTSEGDDVPATFSNWATEAADQAHTIAAPGVCINSTWKGGGYKTISGTSMATPHVSGTAVLCIAAGTCGSAPAEVKTKLLADAETQSTAPSNYGFTGSPSTGSNYYGYLAYAGGF